MAKRVGDLSGQYFGLLKVNRLVGKDKYYDKLWECECKCGNITVVRQKHLRSHHTESCGCRKPQLDDYVNRQFGFLTVRERTDDYICPGNGKHYVQYKCECVCGNIVTVIGLNLKNHSTISCGCKKPHGVFDDLSGKRFGYIYVKERADDYVNPSGRKLVRYLCKCENCGNMVYELADILRRGEATSCGCVLRSRGEILVKDWLDSHGFSCVQHKTFDGCVSDKGNKLSYDFYLPDAGILIECNGKQHYEAVEFFGGQAALDDQLRHDYLKDQFAVDNDYKYLVLDCRDVLRNPDGIIENLSAFMSAVLC